MKVYLIHPIFNSGEDQVFVVCDFDQLLHWVYGIEVSNGATDVFRYATVI